MNDSATKVWDIVVIGGGPAGMMAAGRAGALGAEVMLVEKNKTLGAKLLITGGGRCNVTNAETDTRKFLAKFKDNSKYLFSAFSRYGVTETLAFFHGYGMPTKVENELRVFPVSNSAQSVWDVLVHNMRIHNVALTANSPVIGFETSEGAITGVTFKNGKVLRAKAFILATGGKSRPETGSTGDGFAWLKELGHKVADQDAALVPLSIRDTWIKTLQGVAIKNAKITVLSGDKGSASIAKKEFQKEGRILFTHFGVTGPTILNMSRDIGELVKYSDVQISLDICPGTNIDTLDIKLRDFLRAESNKKLKNSLKQFITLSDLPGALAPVILELSGADAETPCHSVTKEMRSKIVHTFKNMSMSVSGLLGVDKAVITSGGVSLDEVDFKTMQSKLYPNLYLTGDILNIDRPTGGYGLQMCWTTGYLAGTSAAEALGGKATK